MGSSKSVKMHRFRHIFNGFFNGKGSVGSPESLKMHRIHNIFHNVLGGMGSVGSPDSFKIVVRLLFDLLMKKLTFAPIYHCKNNEF